MGPVSAERRISSLGRSLLVVLAPHGERDPEPRALAELEQFEQAAPTERAAR